MKFLTANQHDIPSHFEYKGDVKLQDLNTGDLRTHFHVQEVDIWDTVFFLTTRNKRVVIEKYKS